MKKKIEPSLEGDGWGGEIIIKTVRRMGLGMVGPNFLQKKSNKAKKERDGVGVILLKTVRRMGLGLVGPNFLQKKSNLA